VHAAEMAGMMPNDILEFLSIETKADHKYIVLICGGNPTKIYKDP